MITAIIVLFSLLPFLDYPFNMIPNYGKLKKPTMSSVPCVRSDTTLSFQFSGIEFSLNSSSDFDAPPRAILRRGQSSLGSFKLASVYFDPQDCDIESFDADNNGHLDVFVSYCFGPSGRNSSIHVVDAFFFLTDTTFKFVELASFYGGFELFRDFNNDGKVEFACIKWENGDNGSRDFINLFSISNGEFKNITLDTPGFPIVLEQPENVKPRVVKKAPNKSAWFLNSPNVLERK